MDVVLQAIQTLQAPGATLDQRRQANDYLEQLKRGDAHSALSIFGSLTAPNLPVEAQVVGYTVLTDQLVKLRWAELNEQEHAQLSQVAFQNVGMVAAQGRAAWPLKGKAAALLSAVVRQQGADAYASVVPQLIARAAEGPAQAEMACLLLHFISEDLTVFELQNGDTKRAFLSALTNSVNAVFPFLCEMLQKHFMAAVAAQQGGQADALAAHSAVISASLGALTTWVEWTPMGRVAASNVLDACAFFLTTPEFRLPGLDVLKQIAARKRTTEAWDEYAGLMGRVAGALLARSTELGLAAAPGQMPAALARELGYEGGLEEFGRRVAGVAVSLAENHGRALEHAGCRLQVLQLLLSLTAHPYLILSTTTLHLWSAILRDALPPTSIHAHSGGSASAANASTIATNPVGSPMSRSREPSRPSSPAPGTMGGMTGPASPHGGPGSDKGVIPGVLPVPPDAVQALMSVLVDILRRVLPSRQEAGSSGSGSSGGSASENSSMPEYFDTHQEWKEFCVTVRGQAKSALRTAAQLSPEQALGLSRAVVQAALANPAPANSAQGRMATEALETAVHVMEAVMLPIYEVAAAASGASGGLAAAVANAVNPSATQAGAAQASALLDGVEELARALMGARFPEPHLVALVCGMDELHARGLETFGRLLSQRPALTASLVAAALDIMASIPLEAAGQEPPPPRVTREWKAGFEARLSMANAVVNLAKASPSAFAPHLVPLADRVVADWAAGRLREGERVLLWEGLLTAAAGGSPGLLGQMVEWLMAPIAAEWSSPAWHARLAGPAEFVQAYMPVHAAAPAGPTTSTSQSGQGGGTEVGGRAARWALYHQLTLLERALRRAVAPSTSSSDSAAAAAAAAAHPLAPHLRWLVPGLSAILRLVHVMAGADAARSLGPLQGVTEMDDLEKAVRLGEDVDVRRRGDSEPRCVAGASVADARYFLRGMRECATMGLSLAASNVGGDALWSSAASADALVRAVGSNLEAVDHNHARLLLRHIANVYTARCPPAAHALWVAPLARVLMPHLAARLSAAWAAATSTSGPGGPSTSSSQLGADKEGAGKQKTSDEVVNDILLRELTREHLAWLVTMTQPPRSSNGAAGGAAASGQAGGATPQLQQPPHVAANGNAGAAGGVVGQAAPEPPAVFELALLNAGEAACAQAAAGSAVAALNWPDAEASGKATVVCRYLSSLGTRLPALEPFVCGPLLRAAVCALAQVHTANIQAEVLQLLRVVVGTYLARPQSAHLVRATLQDTLQLPHGVLAQFETTFNGVGAEKEKRNAIKNLIAQAGGEEVRKLLASVSKVQLPGGGSASSVAAAAAGGRLSASGAQGGRNVRTPPSQADADAILQGAIFNAIFT